jgi:hypothetical protein
MKICILGMENERIVNLTRYLVNAVEEKEKTIIEY